ncbi:MAG: hypothetical protein GC160_20585 [Acidobacteria bacterium]|nr:hypothetical protein [Acidobacteriota bacterium]
MADKKKDKATSTRRAAFSAAALGLAGAASAGAAETWHPKKERVGGPIRSGNLLFLSGIGGWYPDRRPEGPGDAGQQTGDALTIMKNALEKAGSSMDNVLKVQVSLVDPENNWEPMNKVYETFFKDPRPVRSYFGATGFRRKGQLLQIDCIAYVD